MKLFRKLTCVLMVLAMFLAAVPSAFAEDSAVEFPSDPRFDGKTWDDVITDFMAEHEIDSANVGIGYVNLTTGEEHYVNENEFRVTASMYKVPMNMLFSEKIYNGEMTMDTIISGYKYSDLQRSTIVYSSNEMAEVLWNKCGGYQKYRRQIAPIMGEDPDTVDQMFYKNNYFTPKEMIYCLSLLYNNQDHYPGVIDCMLEAEPDNYFRASESRYTIAHKYGYVAEDGHSYLNDCAIVWTDDPIAIVIFTDNCAKPYSILSDYITLMIDYTEYSYQERLAEEAAEQQRLAEEEQARREAEAKAQADAAARKAEEEAASAQAALDAADMTVPGTTAGSAALSGGFITVALYFGIAVLFIIAVVEVLQHEKKIRVLWGLLAALAAAGALVVCVFASSHGTVVLEVAGDPDETVTAFFNDVTAGDYDSAYACLSNCSDLGLGAQQSSEAAEKISEALAASYSWEFYGDLHVSGMSARRAVLFTYLDLDALNDAIAANVDGILEEVVSGLTLEETYDSDGNYLPAVTEEVYSRAVDAALANAESCYTTAGLVISLVSENGSWYIDLDSTLLTALTGGLM